MATAGTLAPADGWMVAEFEKRLQAAEGSAAAP